MGCWSSKANDVPDGSDTKPRPPSGRMVEAQPVPAATTVNPVAARPSNSKTKVVLGKFEVLRGKQGLLGEGAFSAVHKGWDIHTQEEVAVKSYKVDKSRVDEFHLATKKFLRQIQVLQRLALPVVEPKNSRLWNAKLHDRTPDTCFLRLIDYSRKANGQPGPDATDGNLYVITEVADLSLKDLLTHQRESQTPLTSKAIKNITTNVIAVVATLHAKGLVHLDIKPENLMRAGEYWKLIDVDGCTELNSMVNINDSSISFSPCYCAPEWARFLIEDSTHLRVQDGLDVWSVGISLCELHHLDAVLKPKYASIFREYGSHRKAGFLFLEWLSKLKESLNLPASVLDAASDDFRDLILEKMLSKEPQKRITLAECLEHPMLVIDKECPPTAKLDEFDKIAQLRAKRMQEPDQEKPPLMKGVLYKMNLGGDPLNDDHWLKRDLWLAHNGSLCYFSPKHQKRLIYLTFDILARAKITELAEGSTAHEFAFEISYPSTSDEQGVAEYEVARFASETDKDRKAWVDQLSKVLGIQELHTFNVSAGLINDFRNFKLTIRNRRAELPNEDTSSFLPRYKALLWKLNQDGDVMNEEHWLHREMWIATNGALCYHSKKENRELQYYTAQDMQTVALSDIDPAQAAKPYAFEIRLPPADGLEYAPGVFAASNSEEYSMWIEKISAVATRPRLALSSLGTRSE